MIYVFVGDQVNIIKEKLDNLINELGISNIIKYDYIGR